MLQIPINAKLDFLFVDYPKFKEDVSKGLGAQAVENKLASNTSAHLKELMQIESKHLNEMSELRRHDTKIEAAARVEKLESLIEGYRAGAKEKK